MHRIRYPLYKLVVCHLRGMLKNVKVAAQTIPKVIAAIWYGFSKVLKGHLCMCQQSWHTIKALSTSNANLEII